MTTSNGIVKRSASDIIIIVPEPGSDLAGLKTDKTSQPLAIKIPKQPEGRLEVLQKPN